MAPILERLHRFASEHGIDVFFESARLEHAPAGSLELDLDREPVDLILALGGDGTFLRASRLLAERDLPILGINVGHLGFLTSAPEAEMEDALERVLAGRFLLDRRSTLVARVLDTDDRELASFFALNDFVIHKAGMARVTELDLQVGEGEARDGIGSFAADGVIFASPTGSTAYSMSAGGPIITPEMECIVVTAICPHTLAVRPLVVPSHATIRVRPIDEVSDLVLTVDGQEGATLGRGDEVVVEQGERTVAIVRFPGQTFFQTLRRKLHWAVRSGSSLE